MVWAQLNKYLCISAVTRQRLDNCTCQTVFFTRIPEKPFWVIKRARTFTVLYLKSSNQH
ncbi:Unknown protein sequence [Pseudomonas amygdali pv. lachrymans]|nr:Unknown protein sequence [Pseudomonas amygdali pv. lachrymans]